MNCRQAFSIASTDRYDDLASDEGLQEACECALREQCAKAFDDAFELLNEDGTPAILSLLTALNDLRPLLELQLSPKPGHILDAVVYLLEEGDQILDDDLVCNWVDFISDSIRFTTTVAALYHLCHYISNRRRCLHPHRQPGGRLLSISIAP